MRQPDRQQQQPFSAWDEIFGDATPAARLKDRDLARPPATRNPLSRLPTPALTRSVGWQGRDDCERAERACAARRTRVSRQGPGITRDDVGRGGVVLDHREQRGELPHFHSGRSDAGAQAAFEDDWISSETTAGSAWAETAAAPRSRLWRDADRVSAHACCSLDPRPARSRGHARSVRSREPCTPPEIGYGTRQEIGAPTDEKPDRRGSYP
jgi:hypothetical protein